MRAADMTTEYIKEQIIKNHFNKTCFHDDESDATVILYPCASIPEITDFSQIEYFRLLCSEVTMCGSSDIKTAASHIRNIKSAIKKTKMIRNSSGNTMKNISLPKSAEKTKANGSAI